MHRPAGKLISIILLMSLLSMSLVSCKGRSVSVHSAHISGTDSLSSSYSASGYAEEESFISVYENDSSRLFFDEETGAVAFGDNSGGRMWASLPPYHSKYAANVTAKVLSGEKIYYMDSQSCRASDSDFSYEETGNGIKVTYEMKASDISLSVPVLYEINGSQLTVSTELSGCTLSGGAVLLSLSLVPYLGSSDYNEMETGTQNIGDFFLVPDGCGAVLYTAASDESTAELCFSVYGKEYYENNIPASMAVYGIRSEDSAIAAAVTAGDEISLIRSFRADSSDDPSARIYAEFLITPSAVEDDKITYGNSYGGRVAVSYTCLSGMAADCAGIAGGIREILIRNGYLPSGRTEEKYPLNISVSGTDDAVWQSEELLKILKGKGVNGVNLILEGFLTGGMRQKNASSVKVLSEAGSKKDLSALCDYAKTQEMNVFTGVNVVSSASFSGSRNIYGKKSEFTLPGADSSLRHTEAGRISSDISSFMNNMKDAAHGGFCVLDAGRELYSDFSSANGSLTDINNSIKKNLSAFSVHNKLMVAGCNLNAIKNAGFLKDVPLYTTAEENEAYEAVPFIPAVLHSTYIYTGSPANISNTSHLELLRAVEYGAAPYYSWSFSSSSPLYYENSLAAAVEFYSGVYENLSDLSDKRITDHYLYEAGVYCTEYDSSVKVYVNYNNYSVIIGEISVMPYNYIRIG